ncbi:hypothetical protein JHK87_027130 [Glycine soja]|nr:hypothetical protein JHK87_027130 [Glycine soja]
MVAELPQQMLEVSTFVTPVAHDNSAHEHLLLCDYNTVVAGFRMFAATSIIAEEGKP